MQATSGSRIKKIPDFIGITNNDFAVAEAKGSSSVRLNGTIKRKLDGADEQTDNVATVDNRAPIFRLSCLTRICSKDTTFYISVDKAAVKGAIKGKKRPANAKDPRGDLEEDLLITADEIIYSIAKHSIELITELSNGDLQYIGGDVAATLDISKDAFVRISMPEELYTEVKGLSGKKLSADKDELKVLEKFRGRDGVKISGSYSVPPLDGVKNYSGTDVELAKRAFRIFQQTDYNGSDNIMMRNVLKNDAWWKKCDSSSKKMIGRMIAHNFDFFNKMAMEEGFEIRYVYDRTDHNGNGIYRKV